MQDSDKMREMKRWMDSAPGGVDSMPSYDSESDFVQLRCLIERPRECQTNLSDDSFVDAEFETRVTASIPFQELIETVLFSRGYDLTDAVGAKGAIVVNRKWEPLSLDIITQDESATVGEILSGLGNSLLLKITLCRSNLCESEKVKQMLLRFLLQHSEQLLTDAKCPLNKMVLKQLSSNNIRPDLPDDVLTTFYVWYQSISSADQDSLNHNHNSVAFAKSGTFSASKSGYVNVNRRTLNSCDSPTVAFDPYSEVPRLEAWFQSNRNPCLTEMYSYLEELNQQPFRLCNRPLTIDNIIKWFWSTRQQIVEMSNSINIGKVQSVVMCSKTLHSNGERQRLKRSHSNSDLESEVQEPGVPHLPNRNAVYVIKPLHVVNDTSSDRVEMLQPASSDIDVSPEYCSSPRSPLADVSHSQSPSFMLENEIENEKSDENHNNYSSNLLLAGVGLNEATDLSLRKHGGERFENSSQSSNTALTLQSSSVFPVQKVEKVVHKSESSSASSSPKTENYISGSYFFPPHHLGALQRFPSAIHPEHAIRVAAMTQALRFMHPGAIYNQSRPVFTPPTTPYQDDNQDSSGSINGDSSERKKRSRVFIDPTTEIPQLEQWFNEDSHPSSFVINDFTKQLNASEYRQRFPRLEPKNVQLWFKNHRAKVKRQRLDGTKLELVDGNTGVLGR